LAIALRFDNRFANTCVEGQGTILIPHPMAERTDLLQGTLDLLILKSLIFGPLHGWGIPKWIRQVSDDVLQINQGSLYPALYRLEDREWVSAKWGVSPDGRRAKFYTLTAEGRRQLADERTEWRRFAVAIERVLQAH
jgi:PadR family transcriptional regulator PadR